MTQDTATLKHFELHLNAKNSQQTAIELLEEHALLSKQKLKSAMSNGAVWLESSIGIHRLRRAKKILSENDTLHLYYDENIQQSTPLPAELIPTKVNTVYGINLMVCIHRVLNGVTIARLIAGLKRT